MRAHKGNIYVSTIDFRPTLTYESTSSDWGQKPLTSFYALRGALFAYKREITVVSSAVKAETRVTNICSQLVVRF